MDWKRIIEAALFAADKPLHVEDIEGIFAAEGLHVATIRTALSEIAADYQDRPIELKEVASGYRFQVRDAYSPWIARLFQERPARYSRALLETLAIIAYQQPVTRGDIEAIRGVSVSSLIVRSLMEREWVAIVGHREVPGRPALYATTREFLDYFNLKSISDLPPLPAFAGPEADNRASPEAAEGGLWLESTDIAGAENG